MSRSERRRQERDANRPDVNSPLLHDFDPDQTVAVLGYIKADIDGLKIGQSAWFAQLECGHGTIQQGNERSMVCLMWDGAGPPPDDLRLPCVTCQTGLTLCWCEKYQDTISKRVLAGRTFSCGQPGCGPRKGAP